MKEIEMWRSWEIHYLLQFFLYQQSESGFDVIAPKLPNANNNLNHLKLGSAFQGCYKSCSVYEKSDTRYWILKIKTNQKQENSLRFNLIQTNDVVEHVLSRPPDNQK